MAIEFHCDHCGKMIRTAEDNAGKRGKCPSCHQSVYIPSPPDQLQPLDLAPIDANADRDEQRLRDESRRLAATLLHEKQTPERGPAAAGAAAPSRDPGVTHTDVEHWVVDYVIAMADGQLDKAGRLAQSVRQNMRLADDVIDRLMVDEILPANLARIPRPVLIQFLKQLREPKSR
ncbi:hypothetical protein RAS1_41190 [Phycisphaerae bacterium RAS1]|nr:hypothetical protein RAS1_41190 [Phycisphaerae bacterium RAS1]